ncbi:BA14K family protein [Rhizobium puerariae]|uniref:Lectin-like protein BA14k n=1 Tax=Rhizobium puerariae TaxID=1585791 RepID=A0ABV6AKF6_9HYPH
MKKLAVVALSLVTAFSGIAPAQAFPSVSAPKIEAPQQVQQVQYWRYGERGGRWDRRDRWDRYDRWERRRYDRDRYYRRHRHGPNVGAIIGGFAAGAIIGGALAQPRYVRPRYYAPQRRYVGGNTHVNWCYSRYRSYRAYDNTFQPYYGPRRQCISPY